MEIILCEDVAKVGSAGETKVVSEGFARNFLLPRGLAFIATAGSVKKWQSEKRVREVKLQKNLDSAKSLAAQLEALALSIPARAGREGHLFGSITNVLIAQALLEKGFSVDKRTIEIATPMKALGTFEVSIRLHSEVVAKVKIEVTRSAEPAVKS